jgi:aminoglycoside 6'-N-acetyltransferase
MLGGWLAAPHVARWWADDPSLDALERDYGGAIDGSEPWEVFVMVVDGEDVGLIQRYRIDADLDALAALEDIVVVPQGAMSMDYLIGDAHRTGKGLGTRIIAAFVERLWTDHPSCPCVIVPVHAENRASWRALERSGFVRVAEGELEPDNPADTRDHVISRLDRPN